MTLPMRRSTLEAIRAHALKDAPNEACGFIITRAGRESAFPVANVDADPTNNFTIHPKSYLEAKSAGDLLAVYHSHPDGPGSPSETDIQACNRSGLPWYIYSVPDDAVSLLSPGGMAPLKGRSFIWGVYDCWTLVYDYYKETLGITLPDWEPYEKDFWKIGKNYYIERYAQFGFVPVERLQPHDVLLMQIGADIPIHAGLYQANGTILHHVPGRLSCADVYGDYLRSNTNLILRHRDLL